VTVQAWCILVLNYSSAGHTDGKREHVTEKSVWISKKCFRSFVTKSKLEIQIATVPLFKIKYCGLKFRPYLFILFLSKEAQHKPKYDHI
jgi:hypothetical protein